MLGVKYVSVLLFLFLSNPVDNNYFTESFDPKNSLSSNPINEMYQNQKIDFRLFWRSEHLALSTWWRHAILSKQFNLHFMIASPSLTQEG